MRCDPLEDAWRDAWAEIRRLLAHERHLRGARLPDPGRVAELKRIGGRLSVLRARTERYRDALRCARSQSELRNR